MGGELIGLVAVILGMGVPLGAMLTYYRVRKLRSEERLAAIARGVDIPLEPELNQAAHSRRAGILLVSVPEAKQAELESSLRLLEGAGLRLTIERGEAAITEKPARLIDLDILGNERPGIVRDVTHALTNLGVNIEEFSSDIESAPFTGVEMFRAKAKLRAPDDLPAEELRMALERLAGEIMVDLSVGDGEAR